MSHPIYLFYWYHLRDIRLDRGGAQTHSCHSGDPGVPHRGREGVEAHVAKLDAEIGDLQKLLVTRTLRLKKLGIPCKHRKLILSYAHKYRLGLWRPRPMQSRSDRLSPSQEGTLWS
ncbi:unnamed protein product [Spirodela intermedia]|uniref:Small ribosomal subunit protein mS41 SAM domain-containing protein n=1 Tax=Spirodela intermedia TaxID=51605 RepID=A0A7I8I8F3_SPIIN|nr:unnamed protein product [Spirodela intermedia]CAA6653870.1 unnamed protein product [Spirodela intermedia]